MQQTIAFYNIENLFDVEDNPYTNDDDFLPTSDRHWTKRRYQRKIYKIGSAIAKIGKQETKHPPAIVGLAEIENDSVLEDLIHSPDLKRYDYGYVHYDSPDTRGIDVALLYNKKVFELTYSERFTVFIEGENGVRDYTRDILLVTGLLEGEEMHFIVNHWPSRREGETQSAYKRLAAANMVMEILDNLKLNYENPKVIIFGDFNDNPDNESIRHLVKHELLFNPMETLLDLEHGSINFQFHWNLFDQILCSINFLETKTGTHKFDYAKIFNDKFLSQYKGKYSGQPYRTYVGKKYMGGFSDHFPVYILVKKIL
ncbi:endonuclease/exonuclease/phosphatase family protein [Mangrovimonas sp. TPBH4]|uniref:endonuclease/exonuclease/phosphatase family protein n=1 Tax=Mangrovimonas sp. TPBH4 TaxID=1645914 RepID=UPI0006B50784|nr:endonuclease/exonuclease/phosphatase family protein [Mangrovimonas sp. TPBH4]